MGGWAAQHAEAEQPVALDLRCLAHTGGAHHHRHQAAARIVLQPEGGVVGAAAGDALHAVGHKAAAAVWGNDRALQRTRGAHGRRHRRLAGGVFCLIIGIQPL